MPKPTLQRRTGNRSSVGVWKDVPDPDYALATVAWSEGLTLLRIEYSDGRFVEYRQAQS